MQGDEASPRALDALNRAVELARLGPSYGPNPRVGCVVVGADGATLAEGYHRGAGTLHAEADALANAEASGVDVRGATAYVTLEPCAHTGRTGPCAIALADAGVGAVVYAVPDPNPTAAGGAAVLAERGIAVTQRDHGPARELVARWLAAVGRGRPYVIAKWAATLDGRTAAADGTSIWITGEEARAHAHGVRAEVDAIVVGTGTVRADDPSLSARPNGVESGHQPLRVVMGKSGTEGARVWRDSNALRVDGRDPGQALSILHDREVRTVLVEGGATLTSAFIRAGLVDEVHAYIAPMLLGDGPTAVSGLGIGTMAEALRGKDVTVARLGADTLVTVLLSKGS